jgi:hypothetical protein
MEATGCHVWSRNDSYVIPQKGNTGPQGEIRSIFDVLEIEMGRNEEGIGRVE